jgi:pyruvate,water dikinase
MIDSRQLRYWLGRLIAPDRHLRQKYESFKELLRFDAEALDTVAELDMHLFGHDPADQARIRYLCASLAVSVRGMADHLLLMEPSHAPVVQALDRLWDDMSALIEPPKPDLSPPYVIPLEAAAGQYAVAGGKAANLATARVSGVPTPPGFVITASAFFRYLRDNDLEKTIESLFQSVRLSHQDQIIQVTGEIQELILSAEVPGDIADEIVDAVKGLDLGSGLLAVRSSALAEDGDISFAGQYASELCVAPEDVLSAYKRVIAGKYCPRAVAYRVWHGLTDNATAMASLVLPMMDARAGGVAYTFDPAGQGSANSESDSETLGVYMVGGMAAELVDGSTTPGRYVLTREEQPRILKKYAQADRAFMPDEAVCELGRWAMHLERLFGQPQDVEWTYGPDGLRILQTRPLQQDRDETMIAPEETGSATILASGLSCASPGAACGQVHIERNAGNFWRIPQGAVIVTDTLRPALSQFIDRISAIVSRNGSRASHLSSVARERGVPVVVGPADSLTHGDMVTVDAGAGIIYEGCLSGITERRQEQDARTARVREEYVHLIRRTVHLHLVDSEREDFSPQGFRSLHDVIRYCHEKSVEEMFTMVGRQGRGLGRSRRLDTGLPLVMYVLDFGGGLHTDAGKKGSLAIRHITSEPLSALWDGLGDSRVQWDTGQLHVDWEEFDRISSGLFRADSRLLASYAIVASDYTHLNIRFGYHFSVVDALCGTSAGANYVKFRFKGGGTGMDQRGYRLAFIARTLTRFGYETRIAGDMLDASCSRLAEAETRDALRVLGLILAVTRVMDVKLSCVDDAERESQAFMQRFYPELTS